MSQTLRVSGMAYLIDSALGSQEILLQRPMVEIERTTTIKAAISQAITTTEAALNIGNLTSEGWAFLQNDESDTTSATYISIGFTVSATFYEAIRLGPKDFCLVPLSPTPTWQAKTNASTGTLNGYVLQRNP